MRAKRDKNSSNPESLRLQLNWISQLDDEEKKNERMPSLNLVWTKTGGNEWIKVVGRPKDRPKSNLLTTS